MLWNDALRRTAGHEIFSFTTSDTLCSAPVQTPTQRIRFEPGVWSVLVSNNLFSSRSDPASDSANKRHKCFADDDDLLSAAKGCYVPQNIWGNAQSSTSDVNANDGAPWYTAVGQSELRLHPRLLSGEFQTTIAHELGHVLGFRDRSSIIVAGECDADAPPSIMGYEACSRSTPTTDDVAQYMLIYTPDAPTTFAGTRVQGDASKITFAWTASHVQVEKQFRIDRWEEPPGAPAGWVAVPGAIKAANSTTLTITDQHTVPKQYRVVAVTRALRGSAGDAPSNTAVVPGIDTKLRALTATGATFTFDRDTTTYDVSVSSARARTTVTATASDSAATVVISSGTNSGASPKVFDLGYGRTTINVTVTNGGAARVYTLEITRPAPPPTYSWSATCADGTTGSGTEDTQAAADAARAAFLANCTGCTLWGYSWAGRPPSGLPIGGYLGGAFTSSSAAQVSLNSTFEVLRSIGYTGLDGAVHCFTHVPPPSPAQITITLAAGLNNNITWRGVVLPTDSITTYGSLPTFQAAYWLNPATNAWHTYIHGAPAFVNARDPLAQLRTGRTYSIKVSAASTWLVDAAHGVSATAQGSQDAPAGGASQERAAADTAADPAWTATVTCDAGPGPVALTAPTEQEAIRAASWFVRAPAGCGGAGTYTTSAPASGAVARGASDPAWTVTVTCDADPTPLRFSAPTREEAVTAANWLINLREGCDGAGSYTTSPPATSGQ